MEAPDEAIASAETEAVAKEPPQDSDNRHQREALHHRAQHIFLADQARVKQRQAGAGHHEHESGTGQHPCVVGRTLGLGSLLFQPCQARGSVGGGAGRRRAAGILSAYQVRYQNHEYGCQQALDQPFAVRHSCGSTLADSVSHAIEDASM